MMRSILGFNSMTNRNALTSLSCGPRRLLPFSREVLFVLGKKNFVTYIKPRASDQCEDWLDISRSDLVWLI
jgi:hypothetical protein